MVVRMPIRVVQGLDDGDTQLIADNLIKFSRLHKLNLVSFGGEDGFWGKLVGLR